MSLNLSAFRLGDIRGVYPDEISETFVEAFAHAFVGEFCLSGMIATGRDMRESSAGLHAALNETLASIGIEVVDIGLCPTELGYFASGEPEVQAAIVVTASHNPARYNGLKVVLRQGQAITFENGLFNVRNRMDQGYRHPGRDGSVRREDFHQRYLAFLSRHFPPDSLGGGKIALNGLNGTAVTMAGRIGSEFGLPVTWFRKDPGPMPSEGADPTNPRLAAEMKTFMSEGNYSLGVAWDGDCDRCVCFDNAGNLIPTYYLVGLLVDTFLSAEPGAAIVFDTKLCWNTIEMINRHGGRPVPAKTGHAFMKQKMHEYKAVYGGELSSHHYFGNFYGCDSGMFAWLTVLQLLNGMPDTGIQELVAERRAAINSTPEITLVLTDTQRVFDELRRRFEKDAVSVDTFDGMSFEMPGEWRFSIRQSKTEPVVRLNFEARQAPDTLLAEGRAVLEALEPFRADDRDWVKHFYIQ